MSHKPNNHKHYPDVSISYPVIPLNPSGSIVPNPIRCAECRVAIDLCECVHYSDVPAPGCPLCGGSGWVRES